MSEPPWQTPWLMEAIVEIGQLVQRYGKAIDERDFEALRRIFTPDARLRYEMEGQDLEESLGAWLSIFPAFLEPFAWTSHQVSPPVVEALSDARAKSDCRLTAQHLQFRHDDSRNLWTVYGSYHDECIRSEAGWRISRRHFVGTHTQGERLPAAALKKPQPVS